MLETLALVGGFWFFLLSIFILVVGIVSSEFDSILGGIVTFILLAVALFYSGALSAITAAPFLVVLGLIVYVAAGFAYAILFRYPDYLQKYASYIQRDWEIFQENRAPAKPTREEFYASSSYREYTPKHNADRITAWIALWPWSFVWDLAHKPVRWLHKKLYTLAGEMLDRIGKRVFNRILDDANKR